MSYKADNKRYQKLEYRRCGKSGLKLPPITLGLWHNFGGKSINPESKKMIFRAFDRGVTHFDLANNYGPPPGSAETNFGKVLSANLNAYRDELIISTKAGYDMWPGPYGDWGSKKYITASLDQSLNRMNLEYVDIFYSHRFDPLTPLEETADALAQAVHHGKALYIGISSYSSKQTIIMNKLLKARGVRCLIHQPSYSMINRWIEKDLLKTLKQLGIGCIAFSPLAQGMLSEKYLLSIPKNSRAAENSSLDKKMITKSYINKITNLK
jgi:L-glyceraldehyde 3-phosphate reductase